MLHETLLACGFAAGGYDERPDHGVRLIDCMITNAVRCVPPANKPEATEIAACRGFLARTIAGMPRLRAVVLLGRIAHDAALRTLGRRLAAYPFGRGAVHHLPGGPALFDSYHCSRYNTNTGQLTPDMFRNVFAAVRNYLDESRDSIEGLRPASRRVTI
jgi:uracil-DNA glycosylase